MAVQEHPTQTLLTPRAALAFAATETASILDSWHEATLPLPNGTEAAYRFAYLASIVHNVRFYAHGCQETTRPEIQSDHGYAKQLTRESAQKDPLLGCARGASFEALALCVCALTLDLEPYGHLDASAAIELCSRMVKLDTRFLKHTASTDEDFAFAIMSESDRMHAMLTRLSRVYKTEVI